jgi:hypothetical protein
MHAVVCVSAYMYAIVAKALYALNTALLCRSTRNPSGALLQRSAELHCNIKLMLPVSTPLYFNQTVFTQSVCCSG